PVDVPLRAPALPAQPVSGGRSGRGAEPPSEFPRRRVAPSQSLIPEDRAQTFSLAEDVGRPRETVAGPPNRGGLSLHDGEHRAGGLADSPPAVGSTGRRALSGLGLRQRNRAALSAADRADRKSTRLNSSHVSISYAAFCLK